MTQTTCLASFGPILVIANPSCYAEGPALAFVGRRWVLWDCVGPPWAAVGLRWPSVGCSGPALALRGLLWACVGRRWVLWASVGLRWPSVGCFGPALAFVGHRWVLWAFVGLRWFGPSYVDGGGHRLSSSWLAYPTHCRSMFLCNK